MIPASGREESRKMVGWKTGSKPLQDPDDRRQHDRTELKHDDEVIDTGLSLKAHTNRSSTYQKYGYSPAKP